MEYSHQSLVWLGLTICLFGPHFAACSSGDSGWTCQVDGKIYKQGENFTTSLAGPCVIYTCYGGAVQQVKAGCDHNGVCMDIGQSWTSQCLTFQCQVNNGVIGIHIVNGSCAIAGTCLGVNEIFRQGCFNYTCDLHMHGRHRSYRVLLKEWGCTNGVKCLPANYTETSNCVTRRCEERNGSVGLFDISQACQTPSHECVKPGETYVDKCRTHKCKQQVFLGIKVFSLEPTSALCEDANGKCHGAGDVFSVSMNNHLVHNCTCQLAGISPHYKCSDAVP
ncbi:uncharacterized protein LOC124134368 [Haliotis rufescens]|uniref:uncharacterized protein LOC124134368 n=1 Tax=Haliotis rufescens TaxID=6454 RepID=UPI00201F82A6|nr:uncharacterized protein LOC124134368 [Haliotis rufescens]